MTEGVATSDDAAAAASQRAAEQARLRKERREAKIKAGGSARLNKITGAGGRITSDSTPAAAPANAPPTPFAQDPEEVDISQSYYIVPPASTTPRNPSPPTLSDADLRQMMLGAGAGPQDQEDPLMKMMASMIGSGAGGMPPMPQPQAAVPPPTGSATVWRVLHALFAIGLGLFFALTTSFTGTKVERERAAIATVETEDEAQRRKQIFFWIFATAEVVLLSSRFFFDKASTRSTGFVGTALSYLPQPYRGYLEVAQRYVHIFTAVRNDLLTCIFVLGLCTWLKAF